MIVATKKRQIIEPGFYKSVNKKRAKLSALYILLDWPCVNRSYAELGTRNFFNFDATTTRKCDNMLELQ